ncbi:unnamed protein product [Trichogramma brassicae]|uniref:Uncharacterized protein n=1 Tax=Trichogramma brassicae TaxID=86971 RepID=A0A6H5J334_9HYME|nr:unnamed protein product [Trichogramma brassicae]
MERGEKLKSLRAAVNWKIVKKRRDLLDQLYDLTSDWEVQLPNLRDIFQPEEIDWLLSEAANELNNNNQLRFIKFVASTGYKFGEDRELQRLHRTSAVHLAVKDPNNRNLLPSLFQIYSNVNCVDESGLTHFHVACEFGLDDVVKKFLDLGEDPNYRWPASGDAPLHLAVESGNTELVDLILSHGVDPNLTDQDESGNTPLHEALANDNIEVAKVLLRRGANPNLINEEGKTPLHIICKRASRQEELLAIFPRLAQLDVMDTLGRTPLRWAVENLVPRVVNILLDHGADLSSFVFPTASDFDERFDRRAFSSIYTNFKLRMASSLLVIAENLENRGYEFNRSEALTIMRFFAKHDLFEKPSNLDEFWYNNKEFVRITGRVHPVALNNRRLSYMQLFPKRAVKIRWSAPGRETPLLRASDQSFWLRRSRREILRARPESQYPRAGNGRDSPLHLAVMFDRKKITEMLLRSGADPTLVNAAGLTPVDIICKGHRDDIDSVKMMFELGNEKISTVAGPSARVKSAVSNRLVNLAKNTAEKMRPIKN